MSFFRCILVKKEGVPAPGLTRHFISLKLQFPSVSAPSLAQINPQSLDAKCCHAWTIIRRLYIIVHLLLHSSLKYTKFQYIVQIYYFHLTSLLTNNFWVWVWQYINTAGAEYGNASSAGAELSNFLQIFNCCTTSGEGRKNTWRT